MNVNETVFTVYILEGYGNVSSWRHLFFDECGIVSRNCILFFIGCGNVSIQGDRMNIKEIAKLSGVSVSTVSRVLNNHPYVSKEVREKVLKIIEENHFVPHTGAIDLVRPQSDGIGIVVKGTGNFFFTEMMPIIEKKLYEYGYSVYNTRIHSNEDEIQAAAQLAKSKRVEGIIFMGGRHDYSIEDMKAIDVPYVCCTYTNNFGDLDRKSFSSVNIDDIEESNKAVSYLIENGHKRTLLVLPICRDRSVNELRYYGYCRALLEHEMEMDPSLILEVGDYHTEVVYEKVMEFLKSGIQFDSVFAVSDSMAMVTIKALTDFGYKVPDDISVIGIDGMNISNYFIPTLTTIVQPIELMAEETVDILHDRIKNHGANVHHIQEAVLRVGQSVKKRP